MLVRVILDTCTVRSHLHCIGNQIDLDGIHRSSELLRISIAGGTIFELLEQLIEGRVQWSEWGQKIRTIDSVLDRRWPIFPTGNPLALLSKTQTGEHSNIESTRRLLCAAWDSLRSAACTDDLKAGVNYEDVDGKHYSVRLNAEDLSTRGADLRDGWKGWVGNVSELINATFKSPPPEDFLADLVRKKLGSGLGDSIDLADRLDAAARLVAKFAYESVNQRTPYNPHSDKRRGDAIDFMMLFYLPLPAIVCTADQPFINRVRATGTPQSRLVLNVSEFNDRMRANAISELVAEFQAPEDQLSQWREAAYFHWIERGAPLGDPLHDWLRTEPVA
jgi:hypothetical protein